MFEYKGKKYETLHDFCTEQGIDKWAIELYDNVYDVNNLAESAEDYMALIDMSSKEEIEYLGLDFAIVKNNRDKALDRIKNLQIAKPKVVAPYKPIENKNSLDLIQYKGIYFTSYKEICRILDLDFKEIQDLVKLNKSYFSQELENMITEKNINPKNVFINGGSIVFYNEKYYYNYIIACLDNNLDLAKAYTIIQGLNLDTLSIIEKKVELERVLADL